jgi:Na+/H+ antiporter NhaD/arsenite permease-like protein
MLHSVSGAEFVDFIWHQGLPSSFPILFVTFLVTLGGMYLYGFRTYGVRTPQAAASVPGTPRPVGAGTAANALDTGARIPDLRFALTVVGMFVLTIVAMALRELFGVKLGFIALSGAVLTVLVVEVLFRGRERPEFEAILAELDWRAILFYIGLFALVGAVEKTGVLERLAHVLIPMFVANLALGATLLYWVTVPIVGIVEHDAYILTFLYTIRDLGQQGVDPWPLWWMLLWAGTLGSNLTVAGAPALYVALNICEREEKMTISVGTFLRWSVPFVVLSTIICYAIGMGIWVLPRA